MNYPFLNNSKRLSSLEIFPFSPCLSIYDFYEAKMNFVEKVGCSENIEADI